MDHELKQRLIGAGVVTALCAIFIPMLFDDPVDNSGQLVSELSIPAVVPESAGKLPSSAEQVLKAQDPEPLSTEAAGESIESTGAEEEAAEPEPGQSNQGRSGDALYTESEGYAREDNGAVESEIPPNHPLSKAGVDDNGNLDNQAKSHLAQGRAFDSAQSKPLSAETAKNMVPKAPVRDTHVETKEAAKVKKITETVKPAVKKLEVESAIVAAIPAPTKQTGNAKSLAAAVAEAKTPAATPKVIPKLVRWYVQVGSFSKKENATSLWESLHEQGLPATLDTVQTDKGTTYRLRVGPELDGKKAAAMKARLDKQNIKAILISE